MALQQIDLLLAGLRDSSGNALSGGKVYTYEAGTTTPKATYTDSAGASAATNPIILDANGRKQIYADGAYKLRVDDANDVTLFTWDNLFFSRVTSQTSQWPDIYGGTSTGSSSAYAITAPIGISSYQAGQQFTFIANHTNTGASTLNVNGLGAVSLVKGITPSALAANDIRSGELVYCVYDSASGGRFRIISPPADNAFAYALASIAADTGSVSLGTVSSYTYELRRNRWVNIFAKFGYTVSSGSPTELRIPLPVAGLSINHGVFSGTISDGSHRVASGTMSSDVNNCVLRKDSSAVIATGTVFLLGSYQAA